MPPYGGPPPNAPASIPALVLGILGLVVCGLAAPFAVWQGRVGEQQVAQSGGSYGGKGMATAGKILGVVGCVLWGLGILLWIVLVVIGLSAGSSTS